MLALSTSVFAEDPGLSTNDSKDINVNSAIIYDHDTLKANLNELGIDEMFQKSLMLKLEKGEMFESENPEKINAGIKTELTNKTSSNSIRINTPVTSITRTVFPDGSVSVQTVSPGSGTVCGTGYCDYQNTKVSKSTGIVNASFLANFTVVNGGYDYISTVWNQQVTTILSTYSGLSLSITRPSASYSYSAQASMTWLYISAVGATNQHLNLDVKDGNYTSSTD